MVEKAEIYCVAGGANDVIHKNNLHKPGICIHYFPKDVAVWPKWMRFDRRHREDFTLQCTCRRPYAPSGFEDAC